MKKNNAFILSTLCITTCIAYSSERDIIRVELVRAKARLRSIKQIRNASGVFALFGALSYIYYYANYKSSSNVLSTRGDPIVTIIWTTLGSYAAISPILSIFAHFASKNKEIIVQELEEELARFYS